MDKFDNKLEKNPDLNNDRLNPDFDCPVCGERGKELVGAEETVRKSRYKCRKCDRDYWGNQAVGMQNRDIQSLQDL